MTRDEFIRLMQYPPEWREWDMLPGPLIDAQIAEYLSGRQHAPAHYRNAACHFWLQRQPEKDTLLNLIRLSYLDPDPLVSYAFRTEHLASLENVDADVAQALRQNRI